MCNLYVDFIKSFNAIRRLDRQAGRKNGIRESKIVDRDWGTGIWGVGMSESDSVKSMGNYRDGQRNKENPRKSMQAVVDSGVTTAGALGRIWPEIVVYL